METNLTPATGTQAAQPAPMGKVANKPPIWLILLVVVSILGNLALGGLLVYQMYFNKPVVNTGTTKNTDTPSTPTNTGNTTGSGNSSVDVKTYKTDTVDVKYTLVEHEQDASGKTTSLTVTSPYKFGFDYPAEMGTPKFEVSAENCGAGTDKQVTTSFSNTVFDGFEVSTYPCGLGGGGYKSVQETSLSDKDGNNYRVFVYQLYENIDSGVLKNGYFIQIVSSSPKPVFLQTPEFTKSEQASMFELATFVMKSFSWK